MNNFYITAAHSFQINNSATTIAKMRSECYESGKSFECCSSSGPIGALVHIPTDSDGNITHDLALVSISSRIASSKDLLIGHKDPQSDNHSDRNKLILPASDYQTSDKLLQKAPGATVYKNGGTSGLSKGVIVTIGKDWIANLYDERNKERISNFNENHSEREHFIVKASKGNFSEPGDSGSPVWLANMKDQLTNDAEGATLVGVLTGGMIGLNNFSIVSLLDDKVISKFFDEAAKYGSQSENFL